MSKAAHQQFRFSLNLSPQQLLRYYQGSASAIQVTSHCGRLLRFPASRLRPFITRQGIEGTFLLAVDDQNRFLSLKKLR